MNILSSEIKKLEALINNEISKDTAKQITVFENVISGYENTDDIKLKNELLMIGDASGKEGQFSDSDKKCAENFGIDYMDVNDFLNYD